LPIENALAAPLQKITWLVHFPFKEIVMAKYGAKAQRKVKRAMHERKHGTLRSGRSGKKVTSRKQAIAIGLSEARREGAKVPRRRSRKTSGRKTRSRSNA
jgi:hypothetical protein